MSFNSISTSIRSRKVAGGVSTDHPKTQRKEEKKRGEHQYTFNIHVLFVFFLLLALLRVGVFLDTPFDLRKPGLGEHFTIKEGGFPAKESHQLEKNTNVLRNFRYIFGFSAGHSGSTTAHYMIQKNCPWEGSNETFEAVAHNETRHVYNPNDPCDYTRDTLIPWLESNRKSDQVWVDLGHYHNLGRTLECLASSHLGSKIIFVGIRRDRYQIAQSFSRRFISPCTNDNEISKYKGPRKKRRPRVSYCPHSEEEKINGPVSLPFDDDDWMHLNKFQKFLWLADEMEYRFRLLEKKYANQEDGPKFLHMSWLTSNELKTEIEAVRANLGCFRPISSIPRRKTHIKHNPSTKDCTSYIMFGLQYQNLVKYNQEQKDIIFKRPQHIKVSECKETVEELVQLLLDLGEKADTDKWVLALGDGNVLHKKMYINGTYL